jgi:hypothetical protein
MYTCVFVYMRVRNVALLFTSLGAYPCISFLLRFGLTCVRPLVLLLLYKRPSVLLSRGLTKYTLLTVDVVVNGI